MRVWVYWSGGGLEALGEAVRVGLWLDRQAVSLHQPIDLTRSQAAKVARSLRRAGWQPPAQVAGRAQVVGYAESTRYGLVMPGLPGALLLAW
jgi:hypothetical protein